MAWIPESRTVLNYLIVGFLFLGEIRLFNTEQLNFGTTPNKPWGYFTRGRTAAGIALLTSTSFNCNIIEFRLGNCTIDF